MKKVAEGLPLVAKLDIANSDGDILAAIIPSAHCGGNGTI
jgi:hypothetical protein